MIIGGAVVLIFGGLFLAKKMEWIGKVEPTEVEFAKVSRSTIIEKVFVLCCAAHIIKQTQFKYSIS